MYVVVRADLAPGLQCAQAVHAAFQFSAAHSGLTDQWLQYSNFLVVCSVPDEATLGDLAGEGHRRGIPRTIVREPDIENEITAVAFAPGLESRKLCASLPLALKSNKNGPSEKGPSGMPSVDDSGVLMTG